MAMKCPNCGGADVSTGLRDNYQCVKCGALFDSTGATVANGPDESTRQAILDRLAPRTGGGIVGNLADLQRMGAERAPDPAEPEFVLPPGSEDAVPASEVEAKKEELAAAVEGVLGDDAKADAKPASKAASSKK